MQPSALPYLCIPVERVGPQTGLHSMRKWIKNPVSKVLSEDSGAEPSESSTGERTFKLGPQGIEGPSPERAAGRAFLSQEEQREGA